MRLIFSVVILSIFITGCVLVNGSINNSRNTIINHNTETIKIKEEKISTCELTLYEDIINIPDLPNIPDDKKSDNVYVETELVKSIGQHREILKKLKEELDRCKRQ